MKIACISDPHGYLPVVDPCDLLLIAGDICPVWDHTLFGQMNWLDMDFRQWQKFRSAIHIVGIAGNHDFIFQQKPESVPKDLKWIYLNCTSTEVNGLKIYGCPWQLWFHSWAFNAPKVGGEAFLKEFYDKIPDGTDIIISHGPPYGYGDLVPSNLHSFNAGTNVGSKALTDYIEKKQPKLVVTGHIHSGSGIYKLGETIICNASVLDEEYKMAYKPSYFEFENGKITSVV